MPNPRLATRYAKSLLDLAVEQNSLDATLKDIQLIENTSRNAEFVNMLRSPIIKADKKRAIIKAIFAGRLSPLTEGFVNLLTVKGRESNLPEIAGAFTSQYNLMKNIKRVKLTTAAPATDAVRDAVRKKVMAYAPEAKIELIEKVNPALIGGFVLEIDDLLLDASISRDLHDVRAQFLKNIYIGHYN